LPTFAIIDKGRNSAEKSCILMERGIFYGMGFISGDHVVHDITQLKGLLTVHPSNDYIKNLIQNYAARHPEKLLSFAADFQTVAL
jgi:DNA polymerase-3 subunit epsilon